MGSHMKNYLDYLTHALSFYRKNLRTFWIFSGSIALLSLASSFVSNSVSINSRFAFVSILLPVAMFLVSLVFVISIYQTAASTIGNKPSLSLNRQLSKSAKKYWSFLVANILLGIIVGAGFILLVIPGIIFAVWYFSALYIMATEDVSAMTALDNSKKLVAGRWWKVLGYLIVLGLMVGIPVVIISIPINLALSIPLGQQSSGAIISALVTFLVGPLEYIIIGLIYNDLKNSAIN